MISINIFNIITSIIVSAVFAIWFIPKILLVSYKKKLFDYSDVRKVHDSMIPRLGGVAFFPSIVISMAFIIGLNSIFFPQNDILLPVGQMSLGICSIFLLYFEGIMDDLVGLKYRSKFVVQIICAFLIVSSGIYIQDLNGIFGVHSLPIYLGVPLAMFIIVFLINAINLIDGIDGLASGLSIVASFFFGVIFYSLDMYGCSILAFATFGTLCPFFYYNVFGNVDKCRKIFMGDTGSQCIGLILAYLAIHLTMQDERISSSVHGSFALAFSILIVPSFDVVRVMIHRYKNHKSMFKPDKNHIHHKLLKLGLTHKVAMVTILLYSMFFVVMNMLLLPFVNVNVILLLDIVIWTVSQILLTKAIKKRNPQSLD